MAEEPPINPTMDGTAIADLTVFTALISAFISLVFMGIAWLKRADDLITDISTGLHRELARAISSSNLAGGEADVNNAEVNVLNPAVFHKFRLMQTTQVSHNTKLLRFEIPGGRTLGLGIGRHVTVRGGVEGVQVLRAYTPTSRPDTEGYFDLLVKTYLAGKLSPYLHSLVPGDAVEVRGPVGRFKYTKNAYKKIGFVAGGTGLTPCLQVRRSAHRHFISSHLTSTQLISPPLTSPPLEPIAGHSLPARGPRGSR